MIIAGLAAEEPWKKAVAADCVAGLKEPEEIKIVASAVPELPVPGKIAAFVSLKGRYEAAVREAALASLDETDTGVRTTALAALIASGTAEDASTLADLASTAEDQQVRDAAFESVATRGLYPAGEGSGYAGGIMSSAVDGIRAAEAVAAALAR